MTNQRLSTVLIILLTFLLANCATSESGRKISSINESDFPDINYDKLKKVDILGIPFGDTVLNEMRTDRNLGVNNLVLQDDFILRFSYLAENFSGDLENMGFQSCYFPSGKDKSNYRDYQSGGRLFSVKATVRTAEDFWNSRYCFLQRVRLPDKVAWKTPRTDTNLVAMPRVITMFLPNSMVVDMDTTGTWPFGHRPNDQIGGRFLGLFLKMGSNPGDCSGARNLEEMRKKKEKVTTEGLANDEKCHLESMGRPSKANETFRAYGKPNEPAFPINPTTHYFEGKDGRNMPIPEDEFPFLLPPNPGEGYYQTKPGP